MLNVAAQTFSIFKGSEGSVDRAYDLPKKNLRRVAFGAIAAFCAALALDETSVLELEENEFQKLFRQIFGGRNLAYLDGPFLIPARQKDEGFEGIQAFL